MKKVHKKKKSAMDASHNLVNQMWSQKNKWDIQVQNDQKSIKKLAKVVYKDLTRKNNQKKPRTPLKSDPDLGSKIMESLQWHMTKPLEKRSSLFGCLKSMWSRLKSHSRVC